MAITKELIARRGVVTARTLVLAIDALENARLAKVVPTRRDGTLLDDTEADRAAELLKDRTKLHVDPDDDHHNNHSISTRAGDGTTTHWLVPLAVELWSYGNTKIQVWIFSFIHHESRRVSVGVSVGVVVQGYRWQGESVVVRDVV